MRWEDLLFLHWPVDPELIRPHLPDDLSTAMHHRLGADGGGALDEAGVTTLVMPPIAYTLAQFAFGFPGTITIRPTTLWNLVEDVVESLEQHGVRRVVLCNSHLERQHVQLLRGVCKDHAEVTKDKAQLLFPDITRRRWAGTLGDEFKSGDCHAGRYESSIVLAADGESVREEERLQLAPKEVKLVEKMLDGAPDFIAIGADEAWCGDPAAATAEEGEALLDQLGKIVATTALEEWPEISG